MVNNIYININLARPCCIDYNNFMVGENLTKKISWLRLICTPSIGPITFGHLLARFKNAETALENLPDFASKLGRKTNLVIPSVEWADGYIKKCAKNGVHLVAAYEKEYPRRLLNIPDHPPIIHIKCIQSDMIGQLLNQDMVAIVGARNASLQGLAFAKRLAVQLSNCELAGSHLLIISGLARGVDTAAHKGALENGKNTIAVVANGLDIVYPPENKDLYQQIAEHGVIVSEMLFGHEPRVQSFGYRNRIISAMSTCVVVVEAAMKSGSLITARYASEHGKDVFAVPGHPYDPRAHGGNYLIRNGAILLESVHQIIEHIQLMKVNKYQQIAIENIEINEENEAYDVNLKEILLDLLGSAPMSIEEILEQLNINFEYNLKIQYIQSALAQLELADIVEIDGNIVRRKYFV